MASPITSPEALLARANEPSLVLLDVRSGPDRVARFEAEHLRGAVFVDLDRDLADIGDPAKGGRHPLPSPEAFGRTLGALGVGPESSVVVYDDRDGANAAARAWWMLRAIGHADVTLLDGGFAAAKSAGFPIAAGPSAAVARAPYPVRGWLSPTVTIDDVDAMRTDPSRVILDARSGDRFRGDVEPFDPVAGHVPGAKSSPYAAGLEDGRLRASEALRAQLAPLVGDVAPDRVVVHCGSGVTACHTLLQLELAGFPGAALWVGSWSEWCRSDRPVGRGP